MLVTEVKTTDQELVAASLADRQIYSQIVNRYQAALARYVRRLGCTDEDDVQDVLQQVFLKAYVNLNGYDPALKFSSWLYRICHNETISFFRRANIRPKAPTTEDEAQLVAAIADERDLTLILDQNLTREKVQLAIAALPEKYREVVVLKYLEDKSYEEISDILQKPLGTIATLLNRAKNRLRQEFGARGLDKIL